MNTKTFKYVISTYFFFTLFYMLVIALDDTIDSSDESEWGVVLLYIALIHLLVFFYNLYSLYKIKPIGKKLFIPLQVIGLMLYFWSEFGSVVESHFYIYLLDFFDAFLIGIIFTSLYFTDLSKDFEMALPKTNKNEQNKINESNNFNDKYQNLPISLFLGILLIPAIGAWFTLKKDTNRNYIYQKSTRIFSFVYAILVSLLLIVTNGSR